MGIDVLIPVLNRPQNVRPLLDSLAVTESPYRVFFICSPKDYAQIKACKESEAETLIVDWHPGPADFAKKINWAFEQTDSEWVFQGADDLRFHAGWDTQAIMLGTKSRKLVIGTNDLHNPAVLKRVASTHTLFARSYIEAYGGTSDNTGRVFCELYDHQFVDTEFVATARTRQQWVFCKQSIVEHLHPHWGFGEMDATYKKAIRATNQDYQLYRERLGLTLRNGRITRQRIRRESLQPRRSR